MRFQERQKTKIHSDQQGSHLKASVRHLGYSRLSGLQSGRVSCCGDVIVFSPFTLGKQRFQTCTIFKSFHSGERFRIDPILLIVFGNVVYKTVSFSFAENGVVWTGSR